MAISFRYKKKKWGQTHYLIDDAEREPYALTGILRIPGRQTKFQLTHLDGSEALYWSFLVTDDKDFPHPLRDENKDEDPDEDESNDDDDD